MNIKGFFVVIFISSVSSGQNKTAIGASSQNNFTINNATLDSIKNQSLTKDFILGKFDEQKAIWERKWKIYKNLEPIERANKILEYSSMPSTSRHHWETEIDLNSLANSYFEKGIGKKEYEWLLKNANSYGFTKFIRIKLKGRIGYNLERWHWSYIPLASKYLSYYNTHIDYSDTIGFKGSELAKTLNSITHYVNGISEKSKHITYSQK